MVAEPFTVFGALSRFLHVFPRKSELERSIENSSFEKLQRQEKDHGFKERPETAQSFFGKGKTGQWKEMLSKKQMNTTNAQR